MNNPGGNNLPTGNPFGQGTVFTILRSFVTRPPGTPGDDLSRDHGVDQDEEMDHLPPLESLNHSSTSTIMSEVGVADLPLPDAHPINPTFATFTHNHPYEGSMPGLQSVSDTSEEDNGNSSEEAVVMPPIQPVQDDDNDSQWSDEDEDLPPLEPIPGNRRTAVEDMHDGSQSHAEPVVGDRRARVEDDHDEDRDRRHPSQRISGQAAPQPQGNAPPFFAGINPPRAAAPPGMIELFQTFMGGAGPPRTPGMPGNINNTDRPTNTAPMANGNAQDPHAHHHHHHHRPMPPIHLTFDMGDGTPPITAPAAIVDMLFPGMGGPIDPNNPNPDNIAAVQELLERISAMGQAFGFPFMEEEKEDPERAKRLVRGLEEVPVGLVRRMEKVGGAPGGHVDEATGEVEAPSCAICWDVLLNEEAAQWAKKEEAKVPGQAAAPAQDDDEPMERNAAEMSRTDDAPNALSVPQPVDPPFIVIDSAADPPVPVLGSTAAPDPTSNSSSASTPASPPTDQKTDSEEEMDPNKIVCLPCAHVFHASCLIPWFSRPRQATCPTCRFNIDPDNLTYNHSRPMPIPMAGAAAGPDANPTPTTAGPVPVPAPGPQNVRDEGGEPGDDELDDAQLEAQFEAFLDANPQVIEEALEHAGITQPRASRPNQPQPQAPRPAPDTAPAGGANPRVPQFGPGLAAVFGVPIGLGMPMNFPTGPGAFGRGGGPQGPGPQHFPPMMGGFFRVPLGPQAGGAAPRQPGGPPVFGPAQAEPTSAQPQQPRAGPSGPPPPGSRQQQMGTQMFTVDFTLFANDPFEGGGVRRQTNIFANQIFGGNGGPVPGNLANATAGTGPAPDHPPHPHRFTPFRFGTAMPAGGPGGLPPRGAAHPHPREKKPWTPPPAPGPTLRSRVEQREREAGLRCSDASCGIGPSDEDPFPEYADASMKQLSIRPLLASTTLKTSVCPHTFHSACLVSAERVAGWGGEDKQGAEVEVACPSCRAVGCISSGEWEEGVRGLA